MSKTLNNILQFLVPKDTKFIPLLEKASTNLLEIASTLDTLVNVPKGEREDYYNKIDRLEHAGDELVRQVNLELQRNFLTPFDREDIHALITTIDDTSDYLCDAATRMHLYNVEDITKAIRKLTEINFEACQLIKRGVECLAGNKKLTHIAVICKKIHELELKADKVHDKSVAEIFENENDFKTVIKYKEVLTALETATDKTKVVSNVLEGVMVKYA